MCASKLKTNSNNGLKPILQIDRKNNSSIKVKDFFETHEKFIQDKVLEGLSPRTIEDHKQQINYFRKFIEETYRSSTNRIADFELNLSIFKEYLHFMACDKGYSSCTVNIRLRTVLRTL